MNDTYRKVKILVIAPYIGLVKLFEEAARKRSNIELTAYESDTTEAALFVKSLPVENYDIIISRGYTCKMIKESCNRHVLDVGISIYDVLRTIRLAQNYNGRFAVVGFHSIIYYAVVLKDMLRYNFDIFTIKSTEEIEDELLLLKNMGYTMIVGDVVTTRIAKTIGLQTILITTSPESVETVLDNSLSLYEEQLSLRRESIFYKELICGMNEGVAVFEKNKNLVFSNLLESEELKKCLKKSLPALFDKKEITFIKTINDLRFSIRGKIIYLRELPMAVFYFKGIDWGRKNNVLLSFLDMDDGPTVSQRTFYTLSPMLKNALSEIKTFQFFSRPVLITGPKGSGKDSFAFYLYQNSKHQNKPMAVIDCNYATEKDWNYLIKNEDSPLFEKGYTLFFKDVHLLNSEQQNQLLMFLCHSGLNKRNQLIFSCVSDFHEFHKSSLKNEIVHILQSLTVTIPSLNERKEDIPNLATLYLNEFNSQMAKQAAAFEPEALKLLQDFNWTGNLYQLRSVIQELILQSESSYITKDDVKLILAKNSNEDLPSPDEKYISLEGTMDDITKRVIRQVLKEENMNQSNAAKRLNIGRSTLRRHMT